MAGKTIEELEKTVADAEAKIAELTKQVEAAKGGDAKAAELQGQVEALTKSLEDLKKQLADSAAELDVYKRLSEAERVFMKEMDEDDAKAFAAMKPEDRKKRMEDAKKNDETLSLHGRTVKKSVVGEDVFEIMKAQAKQIEDGDASLKKEIEKREKAELEKRADDEFGHVPGSVQERAQMLGAIGKMDEDLQKAFLAVFTQSEKLAKAGFAQAGHRGGSNVEDTTIAKAVQDFDTKVAEIASRDKVSKAEAMGRARKAHPDLFKAYQDAGGKQPA